MIEIKPHFECNKQPYSDDMFWFHGKVFLWKECDEDQQLWYKSLPTGHCNTFPIRFTKNGKEADYDPLIKDWLAMPLIRSVVESKTVSLPIKKIGRCENEEVVITNCLDDCYGHVVYKLLNLEPPSDGKIGIIAIVPENIRWMVPDRVNEVWSVAAPLSMLDKEVQGLDQFIKKQFNRFEKVFLNDRYGIPKLDDNTISSYFRQSAFPIDQFYNFPATISFIYRNDRYWLPDSWHESLYLLSKKYGLLSFAKHYFIYRQLRLFTKLAAYIKRHIPEAEFYLAGMGTEQKVPKWINDTRQDRIMPEMEAYFNRIYAQSHLVIGVHGSNMLIPTTLAAGYINLLPDFKIPNMTEDIIKPVINRSSTFLGRHLPAYSKAKIVGAHAVNMINGMSMSKYLKRDGS
jgi:hypothetical protein